jgi:hypothetical protein
MGGLTRGVAAINGGFYLLTKSLMENDCGHTALFRDICLLREEFDRLIGRLKPSILFQDNEPVGTSATGMASDQRS